MLVLLSDILDHHIELSLVKLLDSPLSRASNLKIFPLSDMPILSSHFLCLASNSPEGSMAEDALDGTLVHMRFFP